MNSRRIDAENLRRDATGGGLASNEAVPSLSALTDDVHGVAVLTVSFVMKRSSID